MPESREFEKEKTNTEFKSKYFFVVLTYLKCTSLISTSFKLAEYAQTHEHSRHSVCEPLLPIRYRFT